MGESDSATKLRQAWLRELACSHFDDLVELFDGVITPLNVQFRDLKKPEVGLVLVAGRVGAIGDPFGVGEVTVSRCVIELDGVTGVGYIRGRNPHHARMIAVIDALLQGERADIAKRLVVDPLVERRQQRERSRSAEVNASRVEFFTLVRGD